MRNFRRIIFRESEDIDNNNNNNNSFIYSWIKNLINLQQFKYNCLDKNPNIFQTTRFNHTMIFFKLID